MLCFLLLYNGEITIIGKYKEETRARQINRHKNTNCTFSRSKIHIENITALLVLFLKYV